MFLIGDRVRCVAVQDGNHRTLNKLGTVINTVINKFTDAGVSWCAVEFDEHIGGHDDSGGQTGHVWCFPPEKLVLATSKECVMYYYIRTVAQDHDCSALVVKGTMVGDLLEGKVILSTRCAKCDLPGRHLDGMAFKKRNSEFMITDIARNFYCLTPQLSRWLVEATTTS